MNKFKKSAMLFGKDGSAGESDAIANYLEVLSVLIGDTLDAINIAGLKITPDGMDEILEGLKNAIDTSSVQISKYVKTEDRPTDNNPNSILKDSGSRREFETGAVRDISEGKGRCDLLPLDVVDMLCSAPELALIESFKKTKDIRSLLSAIKCFANVAQLDTYSLLLEVSKHFEAGAAKYGENNWQKGIPLHCYLDSAVRHYLKHCRGDKDEPHDRAFVWNLLCAIWTFNHKPELDDVEMDLVDEPLNTKPLVWDAPDPSTFIGKVTTEEFEDGIRVRINKTAEMDLEDAMVKSKWTPRINIPESY